MTNNKTMLVTGGAGYIGSHMVRFLLENKYKVILFDNFSRSSKDLVKVLKTFGDLDAVEGDLRKKEDISKVIKANDIEAVFHFGALCSVSESVEKPELYFENNVLGSLNLINAVKESNISKFIFSSTCAVYGESQYLPIDEQHQTIPTNPYGESKLIVEKMLKWLFNNTNKHYVVFRYFNVCGCSDDGKIGDNKQPSVHLMQNAIRGALGMEKFELTYSDVDTPDKSPIRDYLDVRDLVDAHYKAFHYLSSKNENLTINLGTGKGNSVEEIVGFVENALSIKLPRQKGQVRKGEYAAVYANNDKASRLLGWKPRRNLQSSVESLVKWYKNNPKGY